MFKIFPIQDEKTKSTYAAACGAVARADAFAYGMADAESLAIMGFSQFDLDGNRATLYDLKERLGQSDFEAIFILGRATLEFVERCGAEECFASLTAADETLLRAIGLRTEREGGLSGRIAGMFDGHCDGHKETDSD
ncbi:MAG: hypothetical protein IKA53_02280 [Clostridia bacterium]|nr:hypothetical protein [Clostridia bacterium]